MTASDYLAKNRAYWDGQSPAYAEAGERNWSSPPSWGIWNVPESELGLLPADMTGLDAIELGCGTGYVSAWLARRGARPVASTTRPRSWPLEFTVDTEITLGARARGQARRQGRLRAFQTSSHGHALAHARSTNG